MRFTEFFIHRPAFTIVLSLVICIIGVLSFRYLPVRWVPSVTPPVVSIYTAYPGASASLVETQITTPIESGLAGVDGIDTISSNSRQNDSSINITFKLGHNINAAVEDVRSALQRVTDTLPFGVKPPSVEKADLNGMPILFLAFANAHSSSEALSDYVQQFIVPRIQTIDGVATVETFGARTPMMKISVDPMKMSASFVTIDDLSNVIKEQNIALPSGQIRGLERLYPVVSHTSLRSANDFNNLILRDNQNQVVRLKDVGEARIEAENEDSAFRVNGQPAIALGIVPQSTANPLDVSKRVLKEFNLLQKTLPNDMQSSVVFDQASFIQSSVNHVYESLFEAIALVLLVIFFFLASMRASFIPIITIPVCLLGTLGILYAFGLSINIITLMAFVMVTGLVVDDAIVMLENIMRHIEKGMSVVQAAILGSREIVFAIIAMTLTLTAVYAPIMFTQGLVGTVFKEFAVTLAGAVLISGFVALTLTPAMCAKLLKPMDIHHESEKLLRWRLFYQKLLTSVLLQKRKILFVLLGLGIIGASVFYFLPSGLAPTEDMNEVDVYIAAPRDASFQYTDKYVRELEENYKSNPEIISHLSQVGAWNPSRSYQILTLTDKSKRKLSATDLANQLDVQFKNIPGVQVFVSAPPSPLSWITNSDGRSIEMEVMSASEYKDISDIMKQFTEKLQKFPMFAHVDNKLKWDGNQFEMTIDREKAADANISLSAIANTISTLLSGRNLGHFEYGGKQYDIKLQMKSSLLQNPNQITNWYVRNNKNQMVPLSDIVSLQKTASTEILPHYDRLRSDTLYASLAPGYTIKDAVKLLQKEARATLPDHVKYQFSGEAKDYLESNGTMSLTFILSLVFIYLVLVAQFESFIDPLIILLTVPFAMVGALIALKLTGGSLNIYSNIALVTLIGLIAKHGILMTDFANKQREQGKSVEDAIMSAAALRLRPILMTTAAMILGALPLALATGSGAETRHQMGWVMVGGLLVGTFFSLIVVPIAYTYLTSLKIKFGYDQHG